MINVETKEANYNPTRIAKKIPVNGGGNFDYLVSEITKNLSAKQKLIILSRYGIGSLKPKTLEEIGKTLSITRERVRQIEQDLIKILKGTTYNSQVTNLISFIKSLFKREGGVLAPQRLYKVVFTEYFGSSTGRESDERIIDIVCLASGVKKIKASARLATHYLSEDFSRRYYEYIISKIEKIIDRKKKPISQEELGDELEKMNIREKYPQYNFETALNFLSITKKFGKNPFGEWGRARWPLVSPRGIREKSHLVFLKEKKPLHFRTVAELIKKHGMSQNKVHEQTVHNELIRDQRFVLVGRGVYALREWGYIEGTVKDVIISVLKKSGGRSNMSNLIREVLRQRKVKKETIVVNLGNRRSFKREKDEVVLIGGNNIVK